MLRCTMWKFTRFCKKLWVETECVRSIRDSAWGTNLMCKDMVNLGSILLEIMFKGSDLSGV